MISFETIIIIFIVIINNNDINIFSVYLQLTEKNRNVILEHGIK